MTRKISEDRGDATLWRHEFSPMVFCRIKLLISHINCFRDGYEVVVRRCRSLTVVFLCPDWGMNKFNWFSRGFNFREPVDANANKHGGDLFTCAYEWRLNMETGEVQESNLMGTEFSIDFPFINAEFTGLRNGYGYAQVINSEQALKVEWLIWRSSEIILRRTLSCVV
ncbi:hypothetical protein EUGRSUZ_C00288 [Eucalyptus grandis]|uniref:Uncharacterized protein n=2 Tax=Eucalyptus grandis TaxID=71139 RepID=A0ACC3LC08_EUCGR|nr:hypothetical protein EUGRSUZ_C00288 [Eucalyptus grandis]